MGHLWAVGTHAVYAYAATAGVRLNSPGFSAAIVAANGIMARLDTVHPVTFDAFKRWLAAQPDSDVL